MVKPRLSPGDRALVRAALGARRHAHAVFSGFRVGAAVRATGGRVHTGCNIEVSNFTQTCCAERVAVFKSLSEGDGRIAAVAVATETEPPSAPCGACRQVLHDFGGKTVRILLCNTAGDVRVVRLGDLLPDAFEPEQVLARMARDRA